MSPCRAAETSGTGIRYPLRALDFLRQPRFHVGDKPPSGGRLLKRPYALPRLISVLRIAHVEHAGRWEGTV